MADLTPSRLTPPQYLLLGQITRPHGIRGEVRVKLFTDYPERITKLKEVFLGQRVDDPTPKLVRVNAMRLHQGMGLLTLHDITDRDAAEQFRNLFLLVRHEDAVPLEDDEFYLYQLIGLRVETSDGLQLGIISKYMETGANDVYIIQSPKYGEILFPATHETIIDHDIANGVVRVNLPDGLINPISDEDADD